MVRNESIKWMLKVGAHYGFTTMTAVLAVNYFDRFIKSQCFQRDKPWMSQLASVACLSIAAKVEETQVPVLLDFQVEEAKYVFEAKTIQRMEILVLVALGWKMNPVTPISYSNHIVRRFELISDGHSDFLRRCENIILSIINDCRLVRYLSSVIAVASMIYVVREHEPCESLEYENQLMRVLRTSKEKTDDCYKLIMELMNNHCLNLYPKNKRETVPSSPSGVIDAYFSSNDSWLASSSPEPLLKKTRAHDHHMTMAPLTRMPVWRGLSQPHRIPIFFF